MVRKYCLPIKIDAVHWAILIKSRFRLLKRVGVQLSSKEMDERMPLKEDMIRIEKGEESEDPFGDDDDDDW